MKRFWLVMLSLGLVLAFSASAMAVDVKFSGSFYAAGMYLDKTNFLKNVPTDGYDHIGPTDAGISTAFYYQRLRVQTDFIVSPGLKLVTRFDAMERIWGGIRSEVGAGDSQSAGTRAENENIAFDLAYVEYASPIGIFHVGYIHDYLWGTAFGDSDANGGGTGGIEYILPIGNFVVGGEIYKEADKSYSAVTGSNQTDKDWDKYCLWGVYNINKDINVGLLYAYVRNAMYRADPIPSLTTAHIFEPYVKAKIGPVSVEAELQYAFGNTKSEDLVLSNDVSISSLAVYVNAVADFGMFYGGGTFAYISGDDPSTSDKAEGGFLNGGADWNPCLIMFNQDITYWAGAIPGYSGTANSSAMSNAWFGQGKVGVRPIAPLDINASLSYAQADKKPLGVINDLYGWEVDVTGTYKLTNNLSYMLGVGYLFTGDYYKGASNANRVNDNYMLINKLTLTF
jgi:hypothetical protein